MTVYAELEIGLHRRDAERYGVELRFIHPGGDADVRLSSDRPAMAQFDLERLRDLTVDADAYGQLLTESLFADPEVKTALAQAYSSTQTLDVPLRLRLFIGPSAPELHGLWWETLRDPQDGSHLVIGEQLLFSRYLSSLDWRPVGLRPRADLRALVVIANPTDLDQWQPGGRPLAPLDVDGELERARLGLAGIPLTPLASGGSASLEGITTHLRDGFDILYLTCHGALLDGKPHLWLEDEAGSVDVVPGDELVTRLREMRQMPRLVVLASCQSAGKGDGSGSDGESRSDDQGALAALGPRLAEAGIPAVLAMQGNVTMQTIAEFMPVFFQELQRDGLIDRAVSVARGTVRERSDWWVPVLFMRLKSGRLWYAPGFAEEQGGLEKWPALLRNIRQGRCTPIVGPGLTENLLGSRRQIAQRWAETYHFPMADHQRENLPQVAQYLAVNQDSMFLRDELEAYLCREIRARHDLGVEVEDCETSLNELVSKVGRELRESDPAEPHRVLAQFPLPIYINANFGNWLAEALAEAGKKPKLELCRWNEYVEAIPSVYDDDPNYRPSAESPMVYHLFGHLAQPDSVVL
ncbi:MAG TPA: CHAT domain-containing protein, partial [Anaerolineae bacterium]|nr:CHAT domain-containing protein [Anaerolineae bacterium]